MSLACIFPGQGSQALGMLQELHQARAEARDTMDEASAALDFDLWQLCREGPEERLNATENTQPALLAVSVAVYRCYQGQLEQPPQFMAGHSLGEYSALVASGALELADAVALVRRRGECMRDAVPPGQGLMVAVLGLQDDQAEQVCAALRDGGEGYVTVANYNAPGQVVLAGEAQAARLAAERCQEAGASRVVELAVSVPSHCRLMAPAAQALAEDIQGLALRAPSCPVVQNVDAQPHSDPDEIRANLLLQLHQPVRWSQCVQAMAAAGVATLVECGPGRVLMGLNRRIDRSLATVSAEKECA